MDRTSARTAALESMQPGSGLREFSNVLEHPDPMEPSPASTEGEGGYTVQEDVATQHFCWLLSNFMYEEATSLTHV